MYLSLWVNLVQAHKSERQGRIFIIVHLLEMDRKDAYYNK